MRHFSIANSTYVPENTTRRSLTLCQDIFNVIINSIIPALADPSNAYNAQHVYILHSLSETQSILLVADVENADSLITSLFSHAFDIFSEASRTGPEVEISKSVEYHLKNLLSLVIDEVEVPQEVTDVILSQFLRVDSRKTREQPPKGRKSEIQDKAQGTLLLKDYPPAYNIAKSICTTCQEKMTAQITQYFNAVIVDAGAATEGKGDSADKKVATADAEDDETLSDLRKAHKLLRELWRACPDVLINVIPQIEAELQADSVALRKLATETLGDIAAGIGIAGLSSAKGLDAAAYPLPSINTVEADEAQPNPLLTPASPKPFAAVHRTPFENFLRRRNDRSVQVREAWADAASRIILTRAGGIGMSDQEQSELLTGFTQILRDQDERVRAAAIRALGRFTYQGAVNGLGADGGLTKPDTVFSALAERFTDRKISVREEAITFAAQLWGSASHDIEHGTEAVVSSLGGLANRLFTAYYTNDRHIHSMLDKVLYEHLLPISFPPIKASSGRRRTKDAEGISQVASGADPDTIRARRILTLVKSLDDRARKVFIGMQGRQTQMKKGVDVYLKACEVYNGGIVDESNDEIKVKARLTTFIESLAKTFPEPSKMASDLWKLATQHDRRNYQLIRFATAPESDYKTMSKAVKELSKRIKEGQSPALNDSVTALLYRVALIVYNRSHVPTIMELARTDEDGLGQAAQVILREISSKAPEVLKSQIKALCAELEESVPSATSFEEASAADALKACAQYARRYPEEIPQERKFLTAMTSFALFSKSPRAAKHAVSIVLTISERKEMYAKEILTKALKDCKPGSPNFLSRIAAISQVCKLAPTIANAEQNTIFKLTVGEILRKNLSPSQQQDEHAWDVNADEETQAKDLALKVMINRCRAVNDKENPQEFERQATAVIELLMRLINQKGEISHTKDTPAAQRNRLRLSAAKLILKMCSKKTKFEQLITPQRFNEIALIIVNPPYDVRAGFVNQIKKYLGQDKLNHRWYTILFLLAFEPGHELRDATVTWLRSRSQNFANQQAEARLGDKKLHQNVMEHIFARLVSVMAHHPDYPQDADTFDEDLRDFSRYMVFYLYSVANEDNLSLIFHVSQRTKQMRDNLSGDDSYSEHLWVLSDLAQAVIRNYADIMPGHNKGANLLQTWPGTAAMPRSLFKPMSNHEQAQQVAEKNYLPEDTALGLEKFVRDVIKDLKGSRTARRTALPNDKKRKSGSVDPEDVDEKPKKKKKSSLPIRKTPKTRSEKKPRGTAEHKAGERPPRKSTRVSNAISYTEADSDDEDAEVEDGMETSASPAVARHVERQKSSSPEEVVEEDLENLDVDQDEEMADTNGNVDDPRIHEDEDGGDEELDDAEQEREPSPSPLKDRENTPGPSPPEKTNHKAKVASKSKTKVKPSNASAKSTPVSARKRAAADAPAPISAKKGKVAPAVEATPESGSGRSTRASRRSRG